MKATTETRNSCIDVRSSLAKQVHRPTTGSPEQRLSCLTRLPVRGKYPRDSGWMRGRRGSEHSFNCTRDSHKWDSPIEESLDGDLVSRVQCNAVRSTLFSCLKRQAQARKSLEIGWLKVQMAQGGQVEG